MNKYSIIALSVLASAAFSQSALALTQLGQNIVGGVVKVRPSTQVSGTVYGNEAELVGGESNAGKKFFDLEISYPANGLAAVGFCDKLQCGSAVYSGSGAWVAHHSNGIDQIPTELKDKTILLPKDDNFKGVSMVNADSSGKTTLSFYIPSNVNMSLPLGSWNIDGYVYSYIN